MNLRAGRNVLPVGVVGDDEPGHLLIEALHHKKVPTGGIQKLKHYDDNNQDANPGWYVAQ